MARRRRIALAILAIWCVLGLPISPSRADSLRDFAWRARLITLAPACGPRDAAWAQRLRQAVTFQAVAAAEKTFARPKGQKLEPYLVDIIVARADAAVGTAEVAGSRAFRLYGTEACKALAVPAMMERADEFAGAIAEARDLRAGKLGLATIDRRSPPRI